MIRYQYEPENKRVAAYEGDTEAGFCSYKEKEEMWIIISTKVHDDFTGKGIASGLVDRLLQTAKKKKRKIVPFCPFAADYVELHQKEYGDLLK